MVIYASCFERDGSESKLRAKENEKGRKKFLTKANEFDKINELLIERTAKKFERASKNKLKKFLTNEKFCDKINELIRVGTAKILDN